MPWAHYTVKCIVAWGHSIYQLAHTQGIDNSFTVGGANDSQGGIYKGQWGRNSKNMERVVIKPKRREFCKKAPTSKGADPQPEQTYRDPHPDQSSGEKNTMKVLKRICWTTKNFFAWFTPCVCIYFLPQPI